MDIFHDISTLFRGRVWTDAVELLIIGAAMYVVLRFLRGTRGEGLLRGVLVLLVIGTLVVNVFANALELERIRVLYPPFVAGLFLCALVAFQPELRRALIRLGGAHLFGGGGGALEQVIDQVVEAVRDLSASRIGAIVAFQRSTDLGVFLESGCKMDSEVTKELLATIFWPGSALHDMGVVIANGRLAAAAVQFPMTDQEGLDASLGARHRAAIGLSQESDAVIVIVSEETGNISVAENGRLDRKFTPETLRQHLIERLGRKSDREAVEHA